MAGDLAAIISQVGKEKGIDKETLVSVVESAILSAAKKHFGHNVTLEAQFNPDTGKVDIFRFMTVVNKVEDPSTQISLEEARANYDSEAAIGDEIGIPLDSKLLGRIEAQTAKQVIIQKIRDAERRVIFDEYKDSKGELINGIVQRYDRGSLIVNLGRTEGVLPKREQIFRERYRQGDRIRCLILDIDPSNKGPQIILSRSHPDFVRKLFELEVPEIAEGTIEIKAIAREPGDRTKIAVYAADGNIDPVGACVGVKGSRVQAVVQELRGERIDIITWTPDAPSFVARSLSPAEVSRVIMDEENNEMEVIVADDQLSLAIGRRGQNVKLASKLTGWKIDVRSLSSIEEEAKVARAALESIPGVDFTQAEMLFQAGFRSVKEVSESSPEELAEVCEIEEEKAKEIIESAQELYEKRLAEGESEEIEAKIAGHDLEKLLIGPELCQKLVASKVTTINALAAMDEDDIAMLPGITADEAKIIRDATERFLKEGTKKPSLGGSSKRPF